MRNDHHLAIKLRKKGMSYNKISKELGIPKSTISYWFKCEEWSDDIKKELTRKALFVAKKRLRLINKRRRKMWEEWREGYRQEAREEYKKLKKSPLFVAGLILYWGEGDSKIENSLVRLGNTDSEMIRIFCLFLRNIANVPVDKIKLSLVLYPDLNDKTCRRFWSKSSGIKNISFHKTQFIEGRHPTKRLSYGICTVFVSSRALKEKIFTWLHLFQEDLKDAGVV